jgi:hypothetical protein
MRVEKAQEIVGKLIAATQNTDRRIEETERRIIESDELIGYYSLKSFGRTAD